MNWVKISKDKNSVKKLLSVLFLGLVCFFVYHNNFNDIEVNKTISKINQEEVKSDTRIEDLKTLAEQGDVKSQLTLGGMYFDGLEVSRDIQQAIKYYELAANQGIAEAYYNLGFISEDYGSLFGHESYQEAIKYYKLAIDKGDSNAHYRLGSMYDKGIGISQDYQEAIKHYKIAAEQGNADAQINLGWMYDEGRGLPQDSILAYKWLNISASFGTGGEEKRELVLKKLTPEEIVKGQELSKEWLEKFKQSKKN